MNQAATGSATARWCIALLLMLTPGCGRSEETARAEDGHGAKLDLLDRALFLEGGTLPTAHSVQRGLGNWSYESSGGSRGYWTQDEGRRVFAAMVMGSEERLEEPRKVLFAGVERLDPTLFRVRVSAPDGSYLKLRSVIDVDGAVQRGPWVDGEIRVEPATLSLPVDVRGTFTRGAVEFQTDCARPTFFRIEVAEERPSGIAVHRVPAGPLHDRRRALGISAGSVLELNLTAREGEVISLAVAAADGDSERSSETGLGPNVRASCIISGRSVARAEIEATPEWRTISLDVPSSDDAATLRLEVQGDGVWVAEDRLDPVRVGKPSTVLLVTSDTHRGDHMGAFEENPSVSTPALDRLAERGLVMTNCFTSTNVTNPSHMALMTGISARDLGILNNTTALSDSARTLAEIFREAGYRTFGATSVMHMRPGLSALDQGFDRYNAPEEGKRDGTMALDRILEWLPDADGEPLFVWLHFYDAHMPYEPPPRLVAAHYPEGEDPRAAGLSLEIEEALLHPWVLRQGIRDRGYMDALYGASVSYVDELLGRAVAHERLGSGMIAFTGDHGESLGEDGVFWSHTRLNASTLHVPLVLTYPGCEPSRMNAPVEQIDLGKTLLAMAGLEGDFPGRDLRNSEEESIAPSPRFAISAIGWSASVELEGWMLTLQIKPYPMPVSHRNWEHGETELFHLPSDPRAANNVLEENFELAKRLRLALVRWLQSSAANTMGVQVDLSADARASLEALGYTDSGETESSSATSLWQPDPDAPWNRRFEDD